MLLDELVAEQGDANHVPALQQPVNGRAKLTAPERADAHLPLNGALILDQFKARAEIEQLAGFRLRRRCLQLRTLTHEMNERKEEKGRWREVRTYVHREVE